MAKRRPTARATTTVTTTTDDGGDSKRRRPGHDHEDFRGVNRKLDQILTQNRKLQMTLDSVKQTVAALDKATTDLATRIQTKQDAQDAAIQALKDQIAAGGSVTAADLDKLDLDLTAELGRLTAIGADPAAPIPTDPLPPIPAPVDGGATGGDTTGGDTAGGTTGKSASAKR